MIIIGSTQKHAKIDYDGVCPCLTSAMGQGGGHIPMFTEEKKMNNLRIRKLTPKECWRLMGFDDKDFEKAQKVNSNTQLYKQAGNSICVPVLERILENLIDKNEHIKILELFGGIGACSKALERLGIDYEIADYVEIDKYAVKSFNAMHDTNFEPQDICEWDKDIDVDLIMHGSPCQDFSLAGKQAGGDEGSGTRSSLMYETVRIVEKLKPKYVIWENVKNIISKKHKHNFDNYLERMEELGYTNYYQVLNAKDYGIPQNRERVFTVSIRNDITIDKSVKPSVAINFEREKENIIKSDKEIYQCECESGWQDNKVGLKVSQTIRANNNNTFVLEDNRYFEFPPKQKLKLKLKDMLEDNVDEKYYLSDKMVNFFYKNEQVQKEKGNGFRFGVSDGNVVGKAVTTRAGSRMDDNFIKEVKIEGKSYMRNFGSRGKIQDKEYADTLTASMGTGGGNVPILKIKNATKQGYLEATEGDGIDISSRMQYHRGNVQKDSIQTITTSGGNDRGVVVKNKIDLSCLD